MWFLVKPEPGCVYFVQAHCQSQLIKVGMCRDRSLFPRLRNLKTASPVPLSVVGIIDTDYALGLEAEIHFYFSAARHHGEWFLPVPELTAFIRSLPPDDEVLGPLDDLGDGRWPGRPAKKRLVGYASKGAA